MEKHYLFFSKQFKKHQIEVNWKIGENQNGKKNPKNGNNVKNYKTINLLNFTFFLRNVFFLNNIS